MFPSGYARNPGHPLSDGVKTRALRIGTGLAESGNKEAKASPSRTTPFCFDTGKRPVVKIRINLLSKRGSWLFFVRGRRDFLKTSVVGNPNVFAIQNASYPERGERRIPRRRNCPFRGDRGGIRGGRGLSEGQWNRAPAGDQPRRDQSGDRSVRGGFPLNRPHFEKRRRGDHRVQSAITERRVK